MTQAFNSQSTKQSSCKGCGQSITWMLTENGKSTPLNLDGTTHWATCPDAKKFKRK